MLADLDEDNEDNSNFLNDDLLNFECELLETQEHGQSLPRHGVSPVQGHQKLDDFSRVKNLLNDTRTKLNAIGNYAKVQDNKRYQHVFNYSEKETSDESSHLMQSFTHGESGENKTTVSLGQCENCETDLEETERTYQNTCLTKCRRRIGSKRLCTLQGGNGDFSNIAIPDDVSLPEGHTRALWPQCSCINFRRMSLTKGEGMRSLMSSLKRQFSLVDELSIARDISREKCRRLEMLLRQKDTRFPEVVNMLRRRVIKLNQELNYRRRKIFSLEKTLLQETSNFAKKQNECISLKTCIDKLNVYLNKLQLDSECQIEMLQKTDRMKNDEIITLKNRVRDLTAICEMLNIQLMSKKIIYGANSDDTTSHVPIVTKRDVGIQVQTDDFQLSGEQGDKITSERFENLTFQVCHKNDEKCKQSANNKIIVGSPNRTDKHEVKVNFVTPDYLYRNEPECSKIDVLHLNTDSLTKDEDVKSGKHVERKDDTTPEGGIHQPVRRFKENNVRCIGLNTLEANNNNEDFETHIMKFSYNEEDAVSVLIRQVVDTNSELASEKSVFRAALDEANRTINKLNKDKAQLQRSLEQQAVDSTDIQRAYEDISSRLSSKLALLRREFDALVFSNKKREDETAYWQQLKDLQTELTNKCRKLNKIADHLNTSATSFEELLSHLFPNFEVKLTAEKQRFDHVMVKYALSELVLSCSAFEQAKLAAFYKITLTRMYLCSLNKELDSYAEFEELQAIVAELKNNNYRRSPIMEELQILQKGIAIQENQRYEDLDQIQTNTFLVQRCMEMKRLQSELTKPMRNSAGVCESLDISRLLSREVDDTVEDHKAACAELHQAGDNSNDSTRKCVQVIREVTEENSQLKSEIEFLQDTGGGLRRELKIWQETARDFLMKLKRSRLNIKWMPHRLFHSSPGVMTGGDNDEEIRNMNSGQEKLCQKKNRLYEDLDVNGPEQIIETEMNDTLLYCQKEWIVQMDDKAYHNQSTANDLVIRGYNQTIKQLQNDLATQKRNASDLREELELSRLCSREMNMLAESHKSACAELQRVINIKNEELGKCMEMVVELNGINCQLKSEMEVFQNHQEDLDREIDAWRETTRDLRFKLVEKSFDVDSLSKRSLQSSPGRLALGSASNDEAVGKYRYQERKIEELQKALSMAYETVEEQTTVIEQLRAAQYSAPSLQIQSPVMSHAGDYVIGDPLTDVDTVDSPPIGVATPDWIVRGWDNAT